MDWGDQHVELPPNDAVELVRAADKLLRRLDAYRRESRTRNFEDLIKAGEEYRHVRNRVG